MSGARDERSDERDQLTRAAMSGARDERSDERDHKCAQVRGQR
jgi:hypothetical protein